MPPDGQCNPVGDEAASTRVREAFRIAESIAQFAVQLEEADRQPTDVVRLIVEGAAKLIPGTDFAAVLARDGARRLRDHLGAGEPLPRQLTDLQNSYGQGPCLEAMVTGVQTRVVDLAAETRWPGFTPAAARLGVVGMLCTPMALGPRTNGTLTLIGTTAPFDDDAAGLARIFAVHAAIGLSGAVHHDSLTVALSSRDVIGQAKGILMERFRMTPDLAFAALVKVSADHNVKLRTVCEELCATGVLLSTAPNGRMPRATGAVSRDGAAAG